MAKTQNNYTELQKVAIAYELSKCHGYCPDTKEAKKMWNETKFEKNEVDVSFLSDYQGNSTNELSNQLARMVLETLKD